MNVIETGQCSRKQSRHSQDCQNRSFFYKCSSKLQLTEYHIHSFRKRKQSNGLPLSRRAFQRPAPAACWAAGPMSGPAYFDFVHLPSKLGVQFFPSVDASHFTVKEALPAAKVTGHRL